MLAGFQWIIEAQLAGSAQPGLLADIQDDLEFIATRGISRIVTLTSTPLPGPLAEAGLERIHFPIPDMGIPTPRACEPLCARLAVDLEDRPVLLHCRGGLGRTGTIAACLLVELGSDPQQALCDLRAINPNYVQTRAQEQFIAHYSRWRRRGRSGPR